MQDTQKKSSKFGIGIILGTVIGGLTALFLSPKSGKENREEVIKKIQELKKLLEEKEIDKQVQEIFGQVSEEAKELYIEAKEVLIKKLAELKKTIENIDYEEYREKVDEVAKQFEKEAKMHVRDIEKLKTHLLKEWKKLKKE